MLEKFFNQHMVPVMMLHKHTEDHFYGVEHGQTFIDWHARSGPTMWTRLDKVHATLRLPILSVKAYDPEFVALEAEQEEQALSEELGVDCYARVSQESVVPEVTTIDVQRYTPGPSTRVHRDVCGRLLSTAETGLMSTIDSRIAIRLHSANETSVQQWMP
ncbi:hypothetical protein PC116_g15645 [Phytophthora cactorum]|uniref:Uncharacterized protein n=3 Tax=Phytophthora cactorum TaxID=29920 RepID=A0A8T1ETN8_9STRA|nr:hypothetical protein Pcac1_g21698 [Phytophthora cactorum]KAG2792917.1 hypothetical protein PC111_g23256 [Phytophthora cactorum]KAG2814579.1 hypothetical protein PC113_g23300 [Phytophthora cactorum]KAG2872672.1 hypothetical protein PC114_g26264 [Phytophthora cactorum]KAG2877597.1 hypothetical protein PC115_g23330 [Phytophthora cactorum]